MKKQAPKKTETRTKAGRRSRSDDNPVEFDRGWQELEQQHDRLKTDWAGLAAMLGVSSKKASMY
ncbi:MAG: hypothetical protein HY077_07370 [Elusimicrobia bacterium]|nr:hypothetical protein [Elusimicrobiota bacterium]